jgi:hypothetical protein
MNFAVPTVHIVDDDESFRLALARLLRMLKRIAGAFQPRIIPVPAPLFGLAQISAALRGSPTLPVFHPSNLRIFQSPSLPFFPGFMDDSAPKDNGTLHQEPILRQTGICHHSSNRNGRTRQCPIFPFSHVTG